MKPEYMIRLCANAVEAGLNRVTLSMPKDAGRFPLLGGGTELLSVTETHKNYSVFVKRLLIAVAKSL